MNTTVSHNYSSPIYSNPTGAEPDICLRDTFVVRKQQTRYTIKMRSERIPHVI